MGISSAFIVEDRTTAEDAKATFDFCRNLIGASKRHRWTEGASTMLPGAREYAMDPDQGLPALFRMFYSDRGELPLFDEEDPAPARTVEIHLDGDSPTIHARALHGIGEWLNSQGWSWQWRDDSRDATADWHRVPRP